MISEIMMRIEQNKTRQSQMKLSDISKEDLEISKLKLEIDGLKKPWKYNHNFIISVVTVFLSCLAVLLQYFKTDREYTLLQIKKEQIILDTRLLENKKSELVSAVNSQLSQLENLKSQSEKYVIQIETAKKQLDDASRLISKGENNEANKKIAEIKHSLESVNSGISEIPNIASGIAYTIGAVLVTSGALSLEKHTDNPTNEPMGKGIGRLIDKNINE